MWAGGRADRAGGRAGGRHSHPDEPPPSPLSLSHTLPSPSSMALASPNSRSSGYMCMCVRLAGEGLAKVLMGFTFWGRHERGHGKNKSGGIRLSSPFACVIGPPCPRAPDTATILARPLLPGLTPPPPGRPAGRGGEAFAFLCPSVVFGKPGGWDCDCDFAIFMSQVWHAETRLAFCASPFLPCHKGLASCFI